MPPPVQPNSSSPESSDPTPNASGAERLIRRLSVTMLAGLAVLILLTVATQSTVRSQDVPGAFLSSSSSGEDPASETPAQTSAPALNELSAHPSAKLAPYLNPSAPASSAHSSSILSQFHELLGQYVRRQTEDDNFTIRVIDRRTNETLERYELTDLRSAHWHRRDRDWRDIDRHRREAMDRLVDEHEGRGVPNEDIIVRWGRANQIEEAHERDRGYQAYERRLAEHLGLSLLATEIGTVETFNQDHLVSAAGARSRYQMLPWILRRSGVNEYTLPTEGDAWIRVREEWHPLLVLEPAFLLLRGYVNAVGHEIPGLSAYHTGAGNVYKLYRQYLSDSGHFTLTSTVADAYAWAVTEGFETVSEGSSFGGDSRGYVPALYGALEARAEQPIEPTPSLQVARVQLKPGTTVTLREILAALDSSDRSQRLTGWGPRAEADASLYERFRTLNAHFDLPASDGDVPAAGNVRLVSSIDGKAVRFFLPLEAPAALRSAGLTVLDSTATFRYDASTYAPPAPHQITRWDRQYEALVEDIQHFGFTKRNRTRLLTLHDRFEALAERHPTRFRRRQLKIISTHRRLWLSNPWEELADATRRATGPTPVQIQPPDSLEVGALDLQDGPVPLPLK